MTRKAADQRKGNRDAGSCGKEVLHRQHQHLGQVAHRAFARITLPVGVGNKADRSIKCRIGTEIGKVLRIQRQPELKALQGVCRQRADGIKQQQCQRIGLPVHLGLGLDAGATIQPLLNPAEPAKTGYRRMIGRSGGDLHDKFPERVAQYQQHRQESDQQHGGLGGHFRSPPL